MNICNLPVTEGKKEAKQTRKRNGLPFLLLTGFFVSSLKTGWSVIGNNYVMVLVNDMFSITLLLREFSKLC